MRIVETVGFYYPDSSGGTEVYLASLLKGLQSRDIPCVVAAPSRSKEACRYDYEGTEVFRYPVPETWLRGEVQGRVLPRHFHAFEKWLRDQRAHVYHQHSWTTACGLWHLAAAKRLGLKTVVTVHVPANVCLRGTMLFEGRSACDGEIRPEKCAACWLQAKGVPARVARRIAALPGGLGPLTRVPRLGTMLAAKGLAANHKWQLQGMARAADRIIAVSGWLYDALLANGIAPTKLVLNRQGVTPRAWSSPADRPSSNRGTFRLAFLGRWDPVKGVHILVEAFKRLPTDTPIELCICAAESGGELKSYSDDVKRLAASDPRIRFRSAIPHADVVSFLSEIDALVVPSQWLETGPLVVLEAFAAGTPVIGSDLGGIKELVGHERNGLLVPHDDLSAWSAAMSCLASDRALLVRLRRGIGPVRTMDDVSRDTEQMYRELVAMEPNAA